MPYREAQYVGLLYLGEHKKELTGEDLPKLKTLITEKSWWETVDTLDAFVGIVVEKNGILKEEMLSWSTAKNLWLRRVAIDFQQEYKEKTDAKLLEQIIENNLSDPEFFIQKAIGWSLRDYSKVNPEFVRSFLFRYRDKLSPLSIKEASKYL